MISKIQQRELWDVNIYTQLPNPSRLNPGDPLSLSWSILR